MKRKVNSDRNKPKIIVVLGPTASGKSDLAVEIAKKFNGEIISADSRQVYKGMNIGTGKITKKEMRGVPHYLLDIANPKKTFTVSDYQKLGRQTIQKILAKGKLPIICGGTGLYIDALIYGYEFPAVPPQKKLREQLEQKPAQELFNQLQKLDPRRAKNIDKFNKRRLIRALEIVFSTSRPVPKLKKRTNYDVLKIGIRKDTEELKERIRKRLEKRLKQGMLEEVKKFRKQGLSWKRLDDLGLEYRYVSRYLRGFLTYEEMKKQLQKEIEHYAKRQITWFKKDKSIHWIKSTRQALRLVQNFLILQNAIR